MSSIKKTKVKSEKIKDGNEIKFKNNKQMFFCTNNNNLLGKNKTTQNKIKDLKNIKLGYLPIQDDEYMKNKIKTNRNKMFKCSRRWCRI